MVRWSVGARWRQIRACTLVGGRPVSAARSACPAKALPAHL